MPLGVRDLELYKAKWIIPVDAPPIESGAILVDAGRLVAVGEQRAVSSAAPSGTAQHDLGEAMIVPGLVNAHAHLDLTCYRGMLPAGPLFPWLDALIALRRRPGSFQAEQRSVLQGAAESLALGVTLIGDISRSPSTASALANSPIRKVCFLELISGAGQRPFDVPTLIEGLDSIQTGAIPGCLMPGVSPHSPYTVTADDLVSTLRLARERAIPSTIHYLETVDEIEWLAGRDGAIGQFLLRVNSPNADAGPSIAAAIASPEFEVARPLLAHVNYPSDEEITRISRSGASVVWCPRAHAYYGHREHRWRDMLAAGINVCIGTDSAACVPSMSILDELREIRRSAPEIDIGELLRIGTLGGAAALGMAEETGSLAVGKRADFVVFESHGNTAADSLVAMTDGAESLRAVYLDGRSVSGPAPLCE